MEHLLTADTWVFQFLQHWSSRYGWLDNIWAMSAVWLVYLIPAVLIAGWFWSAQTKRAAFKAGLAGIVAWRVFSKVLAHFVPRSRPGELLIGARELIFHRPDVSFPSDHAAAFFAAGLTLRLLGHRKLGNILMLVGGFVSVARVMAGVHYPLDVLAGAALGLVTALFIYWLRRPIDRFLSEPFINLMKKVGL